MTEIFHHTILLPTKFKFMLYHILYVTQACRGPLLSHLMYIGPKTITFNSSHKKYSNTACISCTFSEFLIFSQFAHLSEQSIII